MFWRRPASSCKRTGRKSRLAARQFHPRAVEPLEERRLLSATSEPPIVEPLVLIGQGEFQVNTITAGDQSAPSIVNRTDGGYVIGWFDSTHGKIRQRYDAAGTPIGSEVTFGHDWQITTAPSSGFVGVRRSDTTLYAQRFDDDGAFLGGEFQVNLPDHSVTGTDLPFSAGFIKAALVAADGTFVIVWNQTVASEEQLVGRQYDAAGDALDIPFVIDQTNAVFRADMNNQGDWVIAHDDRVHLFKADGTPPIGPIILNTMQTPVAFQQVDIDESGAFFASYLSPDVWRLVQRFDSAGLPIGGPIDLQLHLVASRVMMEPEGFLVVTHFNGAAYGGDNQDVFIRRFDISGNLTADWQRVNTYVTDRQTFPVIAMLSDAEFLVVWESLHQDGSGFGIFAQRFVDEDLPAPGVVTGRHLFYNNSIFDLTNDNDSAIAIDKSAYLPGSGLATFENVTSYSRGINGLMLDLGGQHGTPTLDDFTFRVGTNNDPGTWDDAPLPISLTVRVGAGTGGADRVELIWPDGAIRNTWLEVTVAANFNTGLAAPDVFYFGNKVGDSGLSSSEGVFATTTIDSLAVFATLGSGKSITDPHDYNRDGKVTSIDSLVAFASLGNLIRLDLPGSAQPQVIAHSDSSPSIPPAAPLAAVASALGRAVETIDAPPARKEVLPPRVNVAAAPLNQRAVALAFASSDDLLLAADLDDTTSAGEEIDQD